MSKKIRSDRFYSEILQWLQENVGDILWSQPIVAWHGEGWHMKHTRDVAPRGRVGKTFYLVEFEDAKKATLFALWS